MYTLMFWFELAKPDYEKFTSPVFKMLRRYDGAWCKPGLEYVQVPSISLYHAESEIERVANLGKEVGCNGVKKIRYKLYKNESTKAKTLTVGNIVRDGEILIDGCY